MQQEPLCNLTLNQDQSQSQDQSQRQGKNQEQKQKQSQTQCKCQKPMQKASQSLKSMQSGKRIHFSKAEDRKLKKLVKEMKKTNNNIITWSVISSNMKNRSVRQCRERYTNYLMKEDFNHKGNWTKEENELLIKKFGEYGPNWSGISNFFPGRSNITLKNHFSCLSNSKKYSESISQVKAHVSSPLSNPISLPLSKPFSVASVHQPAELPIPQLAQQSAKEDNLISLQFEGFPFQDVPNIESLFDGFPPNSFPSGF